MSDEVVQRALVEVRRAGKEEELLYGLLDLLSKDCPQSQNPEGILASGAWVLEDCLTASRRELGGEAIEVVQRKIWRFIDRSKEFVVIANQPTNGVLDGEHRHLIPLVTPD